MWVLAVYAISFFVESISGLKLLIWDIKLKSNTFMSNGRANNIAGLVFLVCLGVNYYRLKHAIEIPDDYRFWKWLLVMTPIVVAVRVLVFKYVPRDPNRDNYDFSE